MFDTLNNMLGIVVGSFSKLFDVLLSPTSVWLIEFKENTESVFYDVVIDLILNYTNIGNVTVFEFFFSIIIIVITIHLLTVMLPIS